MKKSEFLLTLADVSQIPGFFNGPFMKGHRDPRIAVVGRSNVGKSTLINALLGAKLAQTSSQPGKTRAIHFYHWKDAGRIVADLPGYGYAKASWSERERWEQFIHEYFQEDENLCRIIMVLDARHGPTPADLEAIKFMLGQGAPLSFVFAKSDTLKTQSERIQRKREATKALTSFRGVDEESLFWVSCVAKTGLKELAQNLKSDGGLDHA